jgi:predicted secreted protein
MESEIKEIKLGTSLPVVLPGLGTAGFQWFFNIDDTSCVAVKPYDYTVDSMFRDAGTSNDEVFMITGKAPGKAIVIFEQRRIWEKEGAAINTKKLDITVM